MRALNRVEPQRLGETAGARSSFFSPDGRWIGFFDGIALKRVSVAGGPAVTICASAIPRGASWGDDGTIVFATSDVTKGLQRVPASGGEPAVLTMPDPSKGERAHWQPSVLPGGRGVLFTMVPVNGAEPPQVAVLDLQSRQIKRLVSRGWHPEYIDSGHLLYVIENSLMAIPFDLRRLETWGDPLSGGEDIRSGDGFVANYALSRNGTLAYVPTGGEEAPRSLVWVDRQGRETPTGAPPRRYRGPRLSPDGTRVAVALLDQERDVRVFDLVRRTLLRLTYGTAAEQQPIWTADGRRIVFASQRAGNFNLYAQAADGTGTAERLTASPNQQVAAWVSPDGSGIVGAEIWPATAADLMWFPIAATQRPSASGGSSPGEPLLRTSTIEFHPEISPDGRFVAYQSNESGRDEIHVSPFPRVTEGRWQVSVAGGIHPAWGRNGRELYYIDPSNALMAVAVEVRETAVTLGNPQRLFDLEPVGPYNARDYDAAPDGRFLVVGRLPEERNTDPPRLVVVLNWQEELTQRVPAR